MDAAKKTRVEQVLVGGLAVFFLLIALPRALKQAGVLGAPRARTAVAGVSPAAAAIPAHAPSVAPQTPAPGVTRQAAVTPRAPTPTSATESSGKAKRDPLKSRLPAKPAPEPSRSTATGRAELARETPPPLPSFLLQGVWWSGDDARALINGELYAVGDQVDGVTITAIGRGGVTMAFEGSTLLLPVAGEPTQPGATQGAR